MVNQVCQVMCADVMVEQIALQRSVKDGLVLVQGSDEGADLLIFGEGLSQCCQRNVGIARHRDVLGPCFGHACVELGKELVSKKLGVGKIEVFAEGDEGVSDFIDIGNFEV